MEQRLHLRCLGEPILSGADGEPIRFKVRKHLALLVYLTIEPRRHHRDHLSDLLWNNLPEGDGRHSLATALSMLRTKVGPDVLDGEREHVRFTCNRIDLDLRRLEVGDVLATEFQPALEIAGFLDGFEIQGSPHFMIWREQKRAQWLPFVRGALTKRIDKCRSTGDYRQIEKLAERIFELDELSEEAVRAKMEARAFAGDRLTALKVYEAWREQLHDDLGAAPSTAIEQLASRLRGRAWDRPSAPPVLTIQTEHWRNRTFVGRAREYQALYEAWQRCRVGEPGHMLVVGDSGIGKSTVVNRLATAAGLEGAVTSRVQCYDVEREIPYATISGLVLGLLDQPGASATPPDALAELARTVPEIRQKFPSIPPAAESQGETARILLTEAFHQLLSALADEQPVILVVDDLHLADDASIAVLHLMMRRAVGQQIMVLFASRSDGQEQSPQAARLRDHAEQLGIRQLEIEQMSDEESSDLLSSFMPEGGEQPGPAARRALLRASSGYPMLLELLVQDWLANGERSLGLALEAMTAEPLAEHGPTQSYRRLFDRLTRSLSPAARNVLHLASILGSRLNDVASYEFADLTVGQTLSGLGALVELRILRERGEGLEFVNEVIRAHAYLRVPSPLRRKLHSDIAGRLLRQHREGKVLSGLEIAWHCFRGERAEEGIPHLIDGARRAIDAGGPHEVELALASAMPALPLAAKSEAELLLIDSIQEQGRWIDSLIVIDKLGALQGDARVQVRSLAAHDHLLDIADDNRDDALAALRELTGAKYDMDVRTRAIQVAANIVYNLRDPVKSAQFLEIAIEMPFAAESTSELRLICARTVLASQAGRVDPAFKEIFLKAESFRANSFANSVVVQVLHCCAAVRCREGKYQVALEHATTAFKIAMRLGNDMAAATAGGNIALCFGRMGNYEEQVRWGRLAQGYLGVRFAGYREINLGTACAFGLAMMGDSAGVMEAMKNTEARIPADVSPWIRQAWELTCADVMQIIGKTRDAAQHANRALSSGTLHADSFAGAYARWVALTCTAAASSSPRETLDRLAANLDTYDAIDQAQILAATIFVNNSCRANSNNNSINRQKLEDLLSRLPSAIQVQFVRLGILPPATSASPPSTGRTPATRHA